MENKYIQSPLNYTGGKYRLLPQIIPLFPKNIYHFIDLFCGGGNVGVNVESVKTTFNDIDSRVVSLLNTLRTLGEDSITRVEELISRYELSKSSEKGYEFYGCIGDKGLASYNKDKFFKLREDYNSLAESGIQKDIMLFTLIIYAFNNQIRFNGRGEYNISVGKRDFNDKMKLKVRNFVNALKNKKVEFSDVDFFDYEEDISSEDFFYLDPPYSLTCATYNERGGWDENTDLHLFRFIDLINERGARFALSNVFSTKGRKNERLMEWSKKYRVIRLDHSYNNASYHKKDRESSDEEVLIVNY